MINIFDLNSFSRSWRRKKLNKFASILEENQKTWISLSVKETHVTNQFAQTDLNQAHIGLRFPKYVLNDLNGRKPVGKVNLQYPANSPGVATGVSFAAEYLTGNDITVRISSNQKKLTDFLYEMVKNAGLGGIGFSYDFGKYFVEQSLSGDCNVFHAFGHDRIYAPLESMINKAIENSLLDLFIAKLAGKDAFLVHPHANIKLAAQEYQIAAVLSAGQICMSPEMAFVPEEKVDEFIFELKMGIEKIKIGGPSQKDTVVGPLMNKKVFDNAKYLIDDATTNYGPKKSTLNI
jgi:acyl-CoA reductase-like NAD-dependent aldehyde dehydrogenase